MKVAVGNFARCFVEYVVSPAKKRFTIRKSSNDTECELWSAVYIAHCKKYEARLFVRIH